MSTPKARLSEIRARIQEVPTKQEIEVWAGQLAGAFNGLSQSMHIFVDFLVEKGAFTREELHAFVVKKTEPPCENANPPALPTPVE